MPIAAGIAFIVLGAIFKFAVTGGRIGGLDLHVVEHTGGSQTLVEHEDGAQTFVEHFDAADASSAGRRDPGTRQPWA